MHPEDAREAHRAHRGLTAAMTTLGSGPARLAGRDDAPWASITACPDGPLLVRGDVEILGSDGAPVPRRRATVALCRCGASAIKPYCDGSHKAIGFTTEDERARP